MLLNAYWKGEVRNTAQILHSFLLNNLDKKESVKLKRGKNCIFTYNVTDCTSSCQSGIILCKFSK